MLTPSIGVWIVPFTLFGSGSPAASRIVGATSMTWCHCGRISFLAVMPLGQWTINPVAVSAVIRRNLLRPRKGRIARDGPARGEVRVGRRAADFVVMFQDVGDGLVHAVEVGHLVVEPVHAAFGARAVVANDVEDERVVELPGSANGVYQSPDFPVCVFAKGRVKFELANTQTWKSGD